MTGTLPVLGFVGSSGSGKTTLLEQVVALLTDAGVRLAVIKHAKPGFDIDPNPRKDSHRLRTAGAEQLLVASRDRWALLAQQADPLREPSLREMLGHLDAEALDGVLVEGFGHEQYDKIEVYRPAHGRPSQCWPHDPSVIAVASDAPLATEPLCGLDLNDPGAVARFVAQRLGLPESRVERVRALAGDANCG
jgi:molybdopterin-guanine dinucleotide biosynthesis protein MobB